MPEELSSQYDPKTVEARIYNEWLTRGFFDPLRVDPERATQSGASRRVASSLKPSNLKPKTYTILLPPPNITGSLHMGHALNATISDILIRYHRMRGFRTAWLPGIDHAGIATQNVVEKELRKQGASRFDLGREKFIAKVWEWKNKYGSIILDQLKRLGASCDWSRTRFTLDPIYARDVIKAFVHYYEKGLIYRGKRVVNWCPRCQTSLSDLEIEYKEEVGKLYFIKYPLVPEPPPSKTYSLEPSAYIVVATTRPETMLGDAAVAANPKDARYKNLIGRLARPPLTSREIPVVADEAVDAAFGTGLVKVTPAHDLVDADIASRHSLPAYEIIDERGRMTAVAGQEFVGLKVAEAREKVVQKLQEVGLLEKIEDYPHSLAKCYRCDATIEPLLSSQWFLKMSELAKKSAAAVSSGGACLPDRQGSSLGGRSKKTRIIPKNFEKGFFAWLANVKDWCISRQIWWGHQLPVFWCAKKQEVGNKKEEIRMSAEGARLLDGQGSLPAGQAGSSGGKNEQGGFIVSENRPTSCPFCKNCAMEQSSDVLDTWFSSALWPFAGFSKEDAAQFFPSDVLTTARDIVNLWVGRMIFSGLEFIGQTPFKTVLIHGTILAKDGRRMSKSLGTGVDPLALVEKYGADATRFGVIWQAMGNQDIRWDEAAVLAGRKFANKIWNASRFVLGRLGSAGLSPITYSLKPKTSADKKIIAQLKKTKKAVEGLIEKYDFGQALHALYDFFWHDFCDVYLEESKKQTDANTDKILLATLLGSLKMLHPFMPHLTEEIYQKLPLEKKSWLIVENWSREGVKRKA